MMAPSLQMANGKWKMANGKSEIANLKSEILTVSSVVKLNVECWMLNFGLISHEKPGDIHL